MRNRRVLFFCVVLALVLASFGGWYATKRHSGEASPVRCREVANPKVVNPLPSSVARDLSGAGSLVNAAGLGTPSLRDARVAAKGFNPNGFAAICGTETQHQVLIVMQESFPVEHCYGPSGSCAKSSRRQMTCYIGFDAMRAVVVHRESCLDPAS